MQTFEIEGCKIGPDHLPHAVGDALRRTIITLAQELEAADQLETDT